MLYHASQETGLKVLWPHESTHGKCYVYAVRNPLMALLFGAPKDDFDLLMDEEGGRPVLYECYPDAFRKIYAGKSCSLYEVENAGFLAHQTGWEQEWVCESPVTVMRETKIRDISLIIMEAVSQGECILHSYSDKAAYQDILREELSERIRVFGMTAEQMSRDTRFTEYFSWLL